MMEGWRLHLVVWFVLGSGSHCSIRGGMHPCCLAGGLCRRPRQHMIAVVRRWWNYRSGLWFIGVTYCRVKLKVGSVRLGTVEHPVLGSALVELVQDVICCDLSFCSDIFFSVMSHVCVWMEVILYHEDDTSGLSGGLYPDGVRFMDK